MADLNNDSPHDKSPPAAQNEAHQFYERLEQVGQLVNIKADADLSTLPARVTHVRYPDGTVKRIRFTASPYR